MLDELLLALLRCDERELLNATLAEDLLDDTRLDELLLEGNGLETKLDETLLDDDLLDTGTADELVETVPQAPKSLQAFAHAQPIPGS